MQTLSNNLKKLRIAAGLSLQEVADAIGEKYKTYQAWETRNIEPPAEMLITLATFYGITVDELLNAEPTIKQDKLTMRFNSAPLHIRKAIISLLHL